MFDPPSYRLLDRRSQRRHFDRMDPPDLFAENVRVFVKQVG
jgi:hypothetical protein